MLGYREQNVPGYSLLY